MDMTPGLDSDTIHTPSHSTTIPYSSSASSGQYSQGQEHTMQQHTQSQASQPKFSSGPHIRSRITVVCAECKRLKLKCDRRTPCSSCLKRDTVPRCVYSQAAAEKIDVQSLHNRILILEGALAKLSSAPPSSTVSSVLGSLPPFKEPFPSSSSSGGLPGMNGASSAIASSGSLNHLHGLLAGHPCTDRALLAIGASGSSVVISLEDVASIWLGELDDFNGSSTSEHIATATASRVKLEPTPVLMPPTPVTFSASRGSSNGGRPSSIPFIPPIPYETFILSASAPSTHVSTPANPFPPANSHNSDEPPQVTPALLKRLPSSALRARYMKALDETMMLHPCFNVRHFEQRVEAMLVWGDTGVSTPAGSFSHSASNSVAGNGNAGLSASGSLKAFAQEVFFGQPPIGKPGKAGGKEQGRPSAQQPPSGSSPKPTLSFFAAACAAMALGALVCQSNEAGGSGSSSADPLTAVDEDDYRRNPAALFALSDQALGLFEKTALYDLDMVIAMILQILYQLHDGQMSVAQGVFPLVGKMINVARMMGLAMDPDEFPGTYSLFEAETRRRIWWDVFYYDLFISDCMGHPPLISDNSCSTRMPADVDEEQFSPSSTTLPAAPNGEGIERGTAYFSLKCRLAQLVKNVKKQTFRDPLIEDLSDLSIDQAAAFEAEVTTFLSELPPAFRLELDHDWSEPVHPSPSIPPILQAQKCELAMLANRLILKLYLPFLKDNGMSGNWKPAHQAVLGTINAAHMTIYASRMLHAVWRHSRPAAFEFYDFGRTLFDAAVVCAHAVIQQPTTILAAEAIKSVGCALDVMRELGVSRMGVEGVRGEGNRSEAIRIVEMMKRKAEVARSANSGGNAAAGTKRKRSPLDDDRMSSNFHLPFVGASVSSVKQDQSRPVGSNKEAATHDTKSKNDAKKQAREKDKEKDKGPKVSPVGIRARPPQGSSASRQRTGSMSSNAPPTSSGRIEPSTPTAGPPPSSSHPSLLPSRSAIPQSPSVNNGYEQYSSRPPPTPAQEHLQRDDYPMHYGASDDPMADRRRYSSQSFTDSPQAPSLFDPQPSPASYTTGPTPPNYYQYPPPPGPPSGYDNPAMGHPHSLPPMASLPPPTSIPMGAQGGGGNMSMSTMTHDHQQYLPFDKPAYNSHMSRPSEHPRQMTQEYQPPQNPQSMPISNSHGWLPSEASNGSDMWQEYKYIG